MFYLKHLKQVEKMNEDYNIDEEYDRYYMSNTIKKNLN